MSGRELVPVVFVVGLMAALYFIAPRFEGRSPWLMIGLTVGAAAVGFSAMHFLIPR